MPIRGQNLQPEWGSLWPGRDAVGICDSVTPSWTLACYLGMKLLCDIVTIAFWMGGLFSPLRRQEELPPPWRLEMTVGVSSVAFLLVPEMMSFTHTMYIQFCLEF